MQVPMELAETHYGEHQGKPFYNDLISFITSAPVFAMIEKVKMQLMYLDILLAAPILQKLHQDDCEE